MEMCGYVPWCSWTEDTRPGGKVALLSCLQSDFKWSKQSRGVSTTLPFQLYLILKAMETGCFTPVFWHLKYFTVYPPSKQ